MMDRMANLVDQWDPEEGVSVFRTDEAQTSAQGSDAYFLDSASRIHFFLEPQVEYSSGPDLDKQRSLNKVGHALHVLDPIFRGYAQSPKVANLAHLLGWVAPEVPQSMYIFKQPEIGGVVTSHQDSTFLYTEPKQTCLGLWLALEDATLENGCLWARRGSHREPVYQRFSRNPEYFESKNHTASMMQFVDEVAGDELHLGMSIEDAVAARAIGFEPLEVKQGDLVAIHGALDHLSLPNYSPKSRHTFQLHLIEGQAAGVRWAESNWLQYPSAERFPALRDDSPPAPSNEL